MDFNDPMILGGDDNIPYSDGRSFNNPSTGRTKNIPLVDNCIFCCDYLFAAISKTTGYRMLWYISFIYFIPVFFFWNLSFISQKPDLSVRNVAFLSGGPSVRFSFGLLLALFLLFSEAVNVYGYVANFISVYFFGSSNDDFFYDGTNGTFGGRDVEGGNLDALEYDNHNPQAEFSEWFGSLSLKLKYVHVFHHLRWLVMSFLVVLPVLVIFATNAAEFKGKFALSRYYIETMDFALGLVMPLSCLVIFKCTVYPIYLTVVTILHKYNGYVVPTTPPHSLIILCLQDACPCNHFVKDQVSLGIKKSLEYHSAYLGFGKLIFVSSVGILFIFSFVSIVLL